MYFPLQEQLPVNPLFLPPALKECTPLPEGSGDASGEVLVAEDGDRTEKVLTGSFRLI